MRIINFIKKCIEFTKPIDVIRKEEYRYLLAYSFSHKVGDKLQYNEGGTGRLVMSLNFMIKTDKDILLVEEKLWKESNIDNLTNISLMSFSKLSYKDFYKSTISRLFK